MSSSVNVLETIARVIFDTHATLYNPLAQINYCYTE